MLDLFKQRYIFGKKVKDEVKKKSKISEYEISIMSIGFYRRVVNLDGKKYIRKLLLKWN